MADPVLLLESQLDCLAEGVLSFIEFPFLLLLLRLQKSATHHVEDFLLAALQDAAQTLGYEFRTPLIKLFVAPAYAVVYQLLNFFRELGLALQHAPFDALEQTFDSLILLRSFVSFPLLAYSFYLL